MIRERGVGKGMEGEGEGSGGRKEGRGIKGEEGE